jgi:hypothetical protein
MSPRVCTPHPGVGHATGCSLSSFRICCESMTAAHQQIPASRQPSKFPTPCTSKVPRIPETSSAQRIPVSHAPANSCQLLSPANARQGLSASSAAERDLHRRLSLAVSASANTCQTRSPATPLLPEQGPSFGAAKNSRSCGPARSWAPGCSRESGSRLSEQEPAADSHPS